MILRGDIVWVDFGKPRGSEPAKIRPAVVMQDDWLLASTINTVLIVPLTSNLALEKFPGNILVSAEASGLEKDSVALVTQIGPVDRDFIDPGAAGRLPSYLLMQLGTGIRLATGL